MKNYSEVENNVFTLHLHINSFLHKIFANQVNNGPWSVSNKSLSENSTQIVAL